MLKNQESDHVRITKVVVLFTTNLTKLSLHFSEFSTIFYAFYKFLQKEYTIKVSTLQTDPWKFEILTGVPSALRLGPHEELGPSNVAHGRWPARFGLNSGEGSSEFGWGRAWGGARVL
jgi:hypothetical protein